MRMFVALGLDGAVREELAACIAAVKKKIPEARPVAAENLHLTLKFLGEVSAGDADRVQETIASVMPGLKPFLMTVCGVGCFPDDKNPRVLWAGARPREDIVRINRAVEGGLKMLGFPEEKKFAAHVTLARFKAVPNRARLSEIIERQAEKEFGRTEVREVLLMQSHLASAGPTYEVVRSFILK